MNLKTFIFKLRMAAYYVLLLSLIFIPVSVLLVYSRQGGWKYGFTFIQNSFEVGIFIGFALAFLVGMYHALNFEVIGNSLKQNYLKSKQQVTVKGDITLEQLQEKVQVQMKYRKLVIKDELLSFRKLVYFSKPDKVSIRRIQEGWFEVESKPFLMWFPVDFGRNFKTVRDLAKMIKGFS